MSVQRVLLVVCSVLLIATTGWAGSTPVAVSPGGPTGALIQTACPAFVWEEVPEAKSYELVVYRIEEDGEGAELVFLETFPGSLDSWTPTLDSCLERGQYAWSVRSVGKEVTSDWSQPSLFGVIPQTLYVTDQPPSSARNKADEPTQQEVDESEDDQWSPEAVTSSPTAASSPQPPQPQSPLHPAVRTW